MPKAPGRKQATRSRILAAAGRRLRAEGLEGAGVAEIMAAAGLTHGGFYAHFAGKEALIAEALAAALAEGRAAWLAGLEGMPPEEACRHILGRYLSRSHRDAPERGCAAAACAGELARHGRETRAHFERALSASLAALAAHMPGSRPEQRRNQAIATFALCLGGLLLARAVADPELSDAVLLACRRAGQAASLA
jgi:TetR/AcrR family transcriptional repressor of nem operon